MLRGHRAARRLAALAISVVAASVVVPIGAASAVAPDGVPTPVDPTAGEVWVNELAWTALPGAAKYRVQVATDSAFSTGAGGSVKYDVTTYNLKATPENALPTGTLYWRVAGMDASTGLGGFSDVAEFVNGGGAAPQLQTPAPDQTLEFPAEPPVFTWLPVPGAVKYRIEVDTEDSFVAPLVIGPATTGATCLTTKPCVTTNTSFIPTFPLNPESATVGADYYWRVTAIFANGVESPVAEPRHFVVTWPNVPSLSNPTDAQSVDDVVLTWAPVAGAATYDLQVSSNPTFDNNVVVNVTGLRASRYSPLNGLPNASYYWRVRAVDALGTAGEWSEQGSPRQFTQLPPGVPTLVSPGAVPPTAAPNDSTARFQWTPVAFASHYELQVSSDPNFSAGVQSCKTNATEYTPYVLLSATPALPTTAVPTGCGPSNKTLELTDGTTYYWRVRAVNVAPDATSVTGTFQGSPLRFTFRPGNPTPLAPLGAVVTTPVLSWTEVQDASEYRVVVRKSDGTPAKTDKTYATSYTPTVELDPADSPFTWEVQAIDMFGEPGLITGGSFTLVTPTLPGSVPVAIAPADGIAVSRMPSMTWTPVAGATRYAVHIVTEGGIDLQPSLESDSITLAGWTYGQDILFPGEYTWFAEVLDGPSAGATTAARAFTVLDLDVIGSDLDAPQYLAPAKCTPASCVGGSQSATPTLRWQPVEHAGGYEVRVALDADFTTQVKRYATEHNTLTPRELYADSDSNQAYYWFVLPCKVITETAGRLCGEFDPDTFPNAFAFRKATAAVVPVSPVSSPATEVANQITLSWQDYLASNQALANPSGLEAKYYTVQVDDESSFALPLLDNIKTEQTTFTSSTRTYPEGPIYWRVQAVDGSGNNLTFMPAQRLTKASPAPALTAPAHGSTVTGVPFLRWSPQNYAKEYEVEVYRNSDLSFSSTNRVFAAGSQKSKLSAWAPLVTLPAGAYAWRVRRLDVDGRPGPWSAGRTFSLAVSAPTLVSPVDGLKTPHSRLLFSWTAVPGAVLYELQTSDSAGFGTIFESAKTPYLKFATTKNFADKPYYWRVRVLDAANNPLAVSAHRTFTKDGVAPTVVTKPATSGLDISGPFTFTFSEQVKVGSGGIGLKVKSTGSPVAGSVTPSSSTLTTTSSWKPSFPLTPNQTYTFTLGSAIKDQLGNSMVPVSFDTRTSPLIDNVSPAMTYFWDRDVSAASGQASGGSYDGSRDVGAQSSFTFMGTQVAFVGRKAPTGGKADLFLDGVKKTTLDFYSATPVWKPVMWSVSGLPDKLHRVTLRVLAPASATPTRAWTWVDAFKVGTVSYEENYCAVPSGGCIASRPNVRDTYRRVSTSNATGGSFDVVSNNATVASGDRPYFSTTFQGVGFSWSASKSPSSGKALVYIDNQPVQEVDLWSSTTSYKALVYTSTTLAAGVHTVRIVVLGTKRAGATGTDISIDSITAR